MANKSNNGVLKYTRVKPITNFWISLLFIFLALLCLMPALLVLVVSFSSEASIRIKGYSYIPNQLSLAARNKAWIFAFNYLVLVVEEVNEA